MMKFLQGVVSETNGTPSSLRISFLVWEIVLVLAFIIVIAYTIISHYHNNQFNPQSSLTWIASILAANRGSKLIQKPFESDAIEDEPESLPSPQVKDL